MAITINHQTNDISATSGSMTIDGASAGASTTWGAVGTIVVGRPQNATNYNNNATASGIVAVAYGNYASPPYWRSNQNYWDRAGDTDSTSGTWRALSGSNSGGSVYKPVGLWIRIS